VLAGKVKITLSCPEHKGFAVVPVTIEEVIREK
jgi:hypothetical protein